MGGGVDRKLRPQFICACTQMHGGRTGAGGIPLVLPKGGAAKPPPPPNAHKDNAVHVQVPQINLTPGPKTTRGGMTG